MVKKVLTDAGFVEGKTFKETKFIKPPKTTSYVIFLDSFTRRGADGLNLIKEHNYTIELYSNSPDPRSEKSIETSLDNFGLEWDKSERYWIESEQLYQVVYTFDFIEK